MLIFIILLVGFSTILISYKMFGTWFNHVAIYSVVWTTVLYLYELRLIYFVTLSIYTWLVIIGAFLSLLLGSLTVFSVKSKQFNSTSVDPEQALLFKDGGRILKYSIYVFSIIGILSALQHWSVLLDEYGTIINVFINAYHVYKTRTSGDLEGVVPYIWLIIYPALFLSGIYTAYKNKLTIATILPMIALILKELANLSRAGILFGFAEFIISFFLFKQIFKKSEHPVRSRFKVAVVMLILLSLVGIGAAFIKTVRQATDTFKGTSSSLSTFKGKAFISPSIYFYGASHVGVLNQFLEKDKERESFGSNTFFTLYSALAKFDLVKQPKFLPPGYFIPNWSNTGTYLRELYNDFGFVGIFIVPFLLGLLSTLYWFKFREYGRFSDLVILTHFYIVISLSFFVFVVRSPAWTIGAIFLLVVIPILEKLVGRKVY